MPTARDTATARAETPPSPSRRTLLAGSTATLLAAAAAVTVARGASTPPPAGDDAELIRLCDRLAANRIEWITLINSRHTIEDEKRTQPENDRLHAERDELLDQIENSPAATTLGAARALARAALGDATRQRDGNWESDLDSQWLAMLAAECLAGAPFESHLVQLVRCGNEDDAGEDVA